MSVKPDFLDEQTHQNTRWIFATVNAEVAPGETMRLILSGLKLGKNPSRVVITPWLLDESAPNAKAIIAANVERCDEDAVHFRARFVEEQEGDEARSVRFDLCVTQSLG